MWCYSWIGFKLFHVYRTYNQRSGQFSCRPLFMYGRFCADHGLALAWPLFPPTTFHIASLHMNIAYLSHCITKWCSTIICTPPKCLRWMVNLAKFILIIMRFIQSLIILCKQPRSCSIDLLLYQPDSKNLDNGNSDQNQTSWKWLGTHWSLPEHILFARVQKLCALQNFFGSLCSSVNGTVSYADNLLVMLIFVLGWDHKS